MLLQRVVTALILLPLLLAAGWFRPPPWLYAFVSAAALLLAWERARLMGLSSAQARGGYVVLTAVLLAATWFLFRWWPAVMVVAAVWWLIATALLPGFPGNLERPRPGPAVMGLIGQVLLLPTILALA